MSNFKPLVSIVIPVYNAAEYLEQGIESLLTQTYTNLEVILVDDRSTDTSWKICQAFAQEYLNVSAFQNEKNSGAPLRSRERGIKEAHGEWITFMDCDDYVRPQYIEHLVAGTEEGKYDIAVTGHTRLYPDGRLEDFAWTDYTQTTKERLASFYQHYFFDQDYWTDPVDTVGQSLIRMSIARQTDFSDYPDTVYGEDSLMALAFLSNTKNGIKFVNHRDFVWRQREGSGSHGGFSTTAKRPEFYRACFDIFKSRGLSPLVSIVVPIYNVERFLEACLTSLSLQTYTNLEIVMVDDKTPDASGAIADEFAAKNSRFSVIHKAKNQGLNMARATGFEATNGKYVMFVDSDDMLVEDCVETALRALIINEADFARFGHQTFTNDSDVATGLQDHTRDTQLVLDTKHDLYMTQFDPGKILGDLPVISMTVWGALYTRKTVSKVNWRDTNYRIYEDNIWTLRYLENVSRGVYLSAIGYLYRTDESISTALSRSLTGNNFNGKPMSYMKFWNYVWNEYRRYNKKYDIKADEIIESAIEHLFVFRAHHLSEAKLWRVEGNDEYLQEALRMTYKQSQRTDVSNEVHLRELQAENARLEAELARTQHELTSHFSVKRAARLTLGNIKRRVKAGNK